MKGILKDSPGELSRVKFGDKITMYMRASREEIHDGQVASNKQLPLMKRDLQTAHLLKDSIILFIKKSEDVSYL